jgi:hypothetical protein
MFTVQKSSKSRRSRLHSITVDYRLLASMVPRHCCTPQPQPYSRFNAAV